MLRSVVASVCVVLGMSSLARAETWPQFRGATGNGISTEARLPTQWSESKGVQWQIDLPGKANSSPAVTSQRIDLTTQTDDDALWVLSFDRATGKQLRRTIVGSGKLAAKGPANLYSHRHNPATPSPIADENFVWAYFGTGLLVCVQADTGKIVWQKDLVKDYGEYDITFGMGSSPRLWKDKLYIACMTKSTSYVVALNKDTGDEVWRVLRQLPAKDDGPDAYSSPIVDLSFKRDLLLVSGSDHVTGYDLGTGQLDWSSSGLDIDSPYGRIIASPVPTPEGIVVATSANPGGGGLGKVVAIDTRRGGNVSSQHPWTIPKTTPDSSTPVALNGLVFMVTDSGIAMCVELKTGNKLWQKRLEGGPYQASLVAGGGHVYFLGTDGRCTVVKADKSGEVVAVNNLTGTFYATPALSDGKLYLRAYEKLYAVGGAN